MPAFYPTVTRLIQEEQVNVIVPTSGFDIYEYSRHKAELERSGVVVAMSDVDAMTTCANKWEFYLKTCGAFPLPETSMDLARWQTFPCFVKPVLGKGSRHSYRCDGRRGDAFYASQVQDLVVQEYLPGKNIPSTCYRTWRARRCWRSPESGWRPRRGFPPRER